MRSIYLLAFFCLMAMPAIQAQPKEIAVNYYFSTGDYVEDKLSTDQIILEVNNMGDDFIYVRSFLDPVTRKKSDAAKAWAVQYQDKTYVNLKYSNNASAPDVFVQIDIKGRFCLAVMDSAFMESVDIAEHYAGNPFKIYDPYSRNTSDAKYFNAAGEMKRIFLIDTKDLSIVLPYKAHNAPVDFLTRSTLKWLVGKENFEGSKKDYTVEEVMEIVEDLNRRQG
jgi:hypothetical protein